ncbi:MAG: cation-translocating P-type ATPase [Planctomycetota bacterium]|nr:cation-translocating P-type ATPase [Planctomycetota bacterium]
MAKLLAHEEAEPTPLQRRLAELGRMLVGACLAIVALIFVLQLLRGGEVLEVFLLSVSLAVAAVPEGLPAVVTMSLALGLQRMAKRNALIRRLPSVETLGAVTTICSDKTGTLTRNEMTVKALVAGGAWYQASGAGYAPEGLLYRDGTVEADGAPELRTGDELDAHPACTPVRAAADPDLKRLLEIAAYCNHAEAVHEEGRGWTVIGDPTEGALVVAARKGGVDSRELPGRIVDERPFDSDRKLMSVALARADGSTVLLVKGAPEMLLARCARIREGGRERALEEADLAKLRAWNARMADRALRVLAFAYQDDPARGADGFPEEDLTFAGLAGMIDPPREEAKEAVRRCQEAGIRPVMITGDHPATALAIARELGIAGAGGAALTGQDLDGLDEAALAARCAEASVFARVTAEHKLRVVGALKSRGEVVAMTGDGVNDAPAVRRADIGIAMGRTGTDVTKEASDMVLTDDNFASIVNAVEEGRGIFDDIRKFIHYLLSCNTGEVLTMFGAALLGWPAPLAAIQILWMNLVTDGLPALALGMEPPEAGAMKRPPRPPHEPVITWDRGFRMLRHGALIAAVTLAGFWWFHRGDDGNLELARTAAFCIAAFAQLFFALACRSFEDTMPQLGPFTNLPLLGALVISGGLQVAVLAIPFLREHFKVAAPSQEEFATILVLALIPVTAIEVAKLARRMAG